jgi:hypothetical protein
MLCAHHWSCDLPFSTRDGTCIILSLARLFDSLVRVSRRVKAPHCTASSFEHHGKIKARANSKLFTLTSATSPTLVPLVLPVPLLCSCCRKDFHEFQTEIMLRRSALTDEMEVRSLSLSRLQVLCHSLSKVLFKLSLTLLVRYRSSYSIFNFSRHIPAASRCIPKQRYSLVTHCEILVYGSTG